GLREQLVAAAAILVRVADVDDDRLLGAVLLEHLPELRHDLLAAAEQRAATPTPTPAPAGLLLRGDEAFGAIGRRHLDQPSLSQQRERHPAAAGDPARLALVVR